jgi:antirestriction protein ArdC
MTTQTTIDPSERRARQREEIEAATRALLTSDGWTAWIRIRSRFSRYSFGNQLLVAAQCPTASQVAGFRTWLTLGRAVRKGEKAIRINAPIPIKKTEPDGEDRVAFRTVPVFDIQQTDPIPGAEVTPLDPPGEPITGDSHTHLIPRIEAFAHEQGWSVEREDLPTGTGGYWDQATDRIVLSDGLTGNAAVRVLIHDTVHALGVTYRTHGRAEAEVITEATTQIVCASVGLDTSGDTIPDIASWATGDALTSVRTAAETIDRIASKLETALTSKPR